MKRSSGVLLAISSLPSKYGIGCFDCEAYRFVDILARAGQSWWQILPLCPTSYGDSPYQSPSALGGSPYYISLSELCQDGLLTREECAEALPCGEDRVDYERQYRKRYPLLRRAFSRSSHKGSEDYCRFISENPWVIDHALFMAIKDMLSEKPWSSWPRELKMREASALEEIRRTRREDVDFHLFLQYTFRSQWDRLKSYANERGVKIMGDMPIYVAYDSVDVWCHPELFQLDGELMPSAVAGCPPDGFSEDGQLWGNPLYRWESHRAEEYKWWRERLSHSLKLYDALRIDHFRGFDEYYSIPSDAATAREGHWEKGPGAELFRSAAGDSAEIIAEDLGFMTEGVRALVRECGYPSMKVLQFAFDSRDGGGSEHMPHNYGENCVAYTGTHDNATTLSWLRSVKPCERQTLRDYIFNASDDDGELVWSMIALLMRSRARLTVIPMQDILLLDDSTRMNIPGVSGESWRWRMKKGAVTDHIIKKLSLLTELYGRKGDK